jgi:CheY-like chemotaxis protein
MPGMSGLEAGRLLAKSRPDLKVILTSGYPDRLEHARREGFPILPKPYSGEAVAAALTR